MRVMVLHSEGGSAPVRGGWIRALNASGFEAAFWMPQRKSAFDAFHDFLPLDRPPGDVFIGTTYDLDPAQMKCIAARPGLRVALFASAWGPLADALPKEEFPIVRVTDGEKQRLEKFKRETNRPSCVFIHASDSNVERVLGGWRSIGIEPVGCLNGADLALYRPVAPRPELACSACFVGSRWPYKSRNIDPFILPLCEPNSGLDVKVFGYHGWDQTTPRYLGRLTPDEEVALYSSAKVCLNISEPHSTDSRYSSDLVERLFKTAACGACVVSDYVEEAHEVFEERLPMAHTPREYEEVLRFYLDHPEDAKSVGDRLREVVLRKHTYFHRAATLLTAVGLPEEADQCLKTLQKVLPGINSPPRT